MIRVTHNGVEQSLDPAPRESLGDLLARLTQEPGGDPRVLVSLRVNAEEVADGDWESAGARSLEGVSELEIESRTRQEVAEQSLEGAADYARRVESAMLGAAARLRQGRLDEGAQLLADIADALSVLLYTIGAAAGLLGGEGAELASAESELEPWLAELLGAHETGDWLRCADLLEFELMPLVAGWREAIAKRRPSGS